jgi:DNA-binding NarL/FixJ family response regulator
LRTRFHYFWGVNQLDQLVIILDDDFAVGQYMQNTINRIPGFSCEHIFRNPLPLLNENYPVDIVLLDVSMPGMNGLEAIEPILKKYPDVSIIMNTVRNDHETIFEAMKKGAVGYVVKHDASIALEEVLETVAAGGAFMTPMIARRVLESFTTKKNPVEESLTEREYQMVEDILEGLSYKMIADRYELSINTIRKHLKKIYRKLNINSKGELFRLAKRQ